jgi:site-specific recombinase XerD
VLISEAFELYRKDVIVFSNQSNKTEECHFVSLRAFVNYAGDLDIQDISFETVREWKNHLDKTRSPTTVRCYVIKFRVVMKWLRQRGYDVMDSETIPVPKREDKVPVFLTKEQVAQCIKATKRAKNKAIISLLYSYGLRVSELCNLNRGQIRDDGSFTVIGKGGRSRLCFTDQRTIKLIKLYLATRADNHPALFLSESGGRIRPGTIQETFKTIRKQTGLECHPHTLRHSFATDL